MNSEISLFSQKNNTSAFQDVKKNLWGKIRALISSVIRVILDIKKGH